MTAISYEIYRRECESEDFHSLSSLNVVRGETPLPSNVQEFVLHSNVEMFFAQDLEDLVASNLHRKKILIEINKLCTSPGDTITSPLRPAASKVPVTLSTRLTTELSPMRRLRTSTRPARVLHQVLRLTRLTT